MDKYKELLDMVKSYEENFIKFYYRGNKAAGVRLRKNMQELRNFAKNVRDEVQDLNKKRDQEF